MTGLAHVFDLRADTRRAERGAASWLIAGRVALQAVALAVALIVFANTQDRSQTIIVALIGLVFASLRATAAATACAQQRIAILMENEIRAVRQTVTSGTGLAPAADKRLEHALDAARKALCVDYAGLTAIAALCLYHLGVAILYGMAYQQLLELR